MDRYRGPSAPFRHDANDFNESYSTDPSRSISVSENNQGKYYRIIFISPLILMTPLVHGPRHKDMLGVRIQSSPTIRRTKAPLLVIFCNKVPFLVHKPITVLQEAMMETNPSRTLVMFIPQSMTIYILHHSSTTPRVGASECILSLHPRLHFHQD
jgi:hypothetical protein